MKRVKYLLAIMLVAVSSFVLFACGGNPIKKLEVSGLPEAINMGNELVLDDVTAKVTYEDGSTLDLTSADLTFGDFDENKAGDQVLKVSYKGFEIEVTITVVDPYAEGGRVNMISSGLKTYFDTYRENMAEGRAYADEFEEAEAKLYYAGDDNPFDLRIDAKKYVADPNNPNGMPILAPMAMKDIDLEFEVSIVNDIKTGSYTPLNESTEELKIEKYMTFNEDHTISFKTDAIGKTFNITGKVLNCAEGVENLKFTLTNITVVDAYNVYDAEDLSVIENSGKDGWSAKKSAELINASNNAKGVVLHNTIQIQDSDLPSELFIDDAKAATLIDDNTFVGAAQNITVAGSLKDQRDDGSDWTIIYRRELNNNSEGFNFYGNYYQIDASQISKSVIEGIADAAHIDSEKKVVSCENPTGDGSDGQAITSHATLFKFDMIKSEIQTAEAENSIVYPTITMQNISMKGNGKRSASVYNSGGICFVKFRSVNSHVERCEYMDFATGLMYEGDSRLKNWSLETTKHTVLNTYGEECYSSLLYSYGSDVIMEDSQLYMAGGPAIIVDYALPPEDFKKAGVVGEFIPNIAVIHSKVENYVNGREPWFETYGAASMVGTLQAANVVYTGNEHLGLPNTYKSFVISKEVEGKTQNVPVMNIVCLLKDGGAQGISISRLKGSITMYNSREDYDAQNPTEQGKAPVIKSYGINCPDNVGAENLVDRAMSTTKPVFGTGEQKDQVVGATGSVYLQSSITGGHMSAGDYDGFVVDTSYPTTSYVGLPTQQEYANCYIFNGMCVMFELFPNGTPQA